MYNNCKNIELCVAFSYDTFNDPISIMFYYPVTSYFILSI